MADTTPPPAVEADPPLADLVAKPFDTRKNLEVYVRVKPVTSNRTCVDIVEPRHIRLRARAHDGAEAEFKFTRVLPPQITQAQVFHATVEKLLYDFYSFAYPHTTCMMYGPTGSGKTFTTLGSSAQPGLFPLSLAHIFKTFEAALRNGSVRILVSALEVYNENIYDLLAGDGRSDQRRNVQLSNGITAVNLLAEGAAPHAPPPPRSPRACPTQPFNGSCCLQRIAPSYSCTGEADARLRRRKPQAAARA